MNFCKPWIRFTRLRALSELLECKCLQGDKKQARCLSQSEFLPAPGWRWYLLRGIGGTESFRWLRCFCGCRCQQLQLFQVRHLWRCSDWWRTECQVVGQGTTLSTATCCLSSHSPPRSCTLSGSVSLTLCALCRLFVRLRLLRRSLPILSCSPLGESLCSAGLPFEMAFALGSSSFLNFSSCR